MTQTTTKSKCFEDHMKEIKQENAEAVGVTPDKLDEMNFTEIEDQLRENKREDFIQSRIFGQLRLRFRDYLYRKKGGGNSLVFGDLYE